MIDDGIDAAKAIESTTDLANAVETTTDIAKKGWSVGDDITTLTKAGNKSAWSTVRQRYWKNEAALRAELYSQANLELMKKGLAPLVELNEKLYSMELHHIEPRHMGGSDAFDNLLPLTPWDHASIDQYRHFRGD